MIETGLAGRWHPDRWRPLFVTPTPEPPKVGQRVGLAYGLWDVVEVVPRAEVDLSEDDRRWLAVLKPEFRQRSWPHTVVLRHSSGPMLLDEGEYRRLHDGAITTHVRYPAGAGRWLRSSLSAAG